MLPKEVSKHLSIKDSFENLCNNADVKKMIADDMLKVAKSGGLQSFEQVCILIFVIVVFVHTKQQAPVSWFYNSSGVQDNVIERKSQHKHFNCIITVIFCRSKTLSCHQPCGQLRMICSHQP